MNTESWHLDLAREIVRRGDELRSSGRAVDRGRLVRPHRGSYIGMDRWNESKETERYLFTVLGAVTGSRTRPIASHISAAVLHGAPLIGPLPQLVHVLATPQAGTRSEHGMRKHATPHLLTDLETRGQLRLTNLVRTLVDVATDAPFVTSVGVLDWALRERGITPDQLHDKLDQLEIRRGRRKAIRAIDFADRQAGSPGESLSRVRIHELGFPRPVLQQRFVDRRGLIGYADFWWPEQGVIGEFDGLGKYVREEFAAGRSPADVVIDEKRREDRLRALGHHVVRWEWLHAWKPYGLNPILLPLLSGGALPGVTGD